MIHEENCTYEVCKLAKEKGFPQQYDSLTHIYGGKDSFNVGIDLKYKKCEGTLFDISEWNPRLNDIVAPTQSLLQRWLREERGMQIYIDSDLDFDDETFVYEWQIANKENFDNGGFEIHRYNSEESHSTYELALEDALKYALENLI